MDFANEITSALVEDEQGASIQISFLYDVRGLRPENGATSRNFIGIAFKQESWKLTRLTLRE